VARKLVVQVVDDLDGREVQDGAVEKVLFGLDGATYLVELRPDNAERLRSDLKKWIHVAQRVENETGWSEQRARLVADTSSYSRSDLQAIRQWALKNGIRVSSRGRISMEVLTAFADAQVKCNGRPNDSAANESPDQNVDEYSDEPR
jgi:hypothetical protein